MSRYKKTITYIWCSELAYIAGLFASDGCLINNGRHLNITSIDREIIAYAQEILCKVGLKVQKKRGQFGTYAYSWQFSDVSLYDFFLKNGITTNKSKTIQSVNVPSKYWGDFLRGYFDGDGTVYGYEDTRWKNSFMFYIGYASASPKFLKWLRTGNSTFGRTGAGSIRKSTRVGMLAYAKADSRLLYTLMYGADTCAQRYSLIRKKQKLESFINRG